MNMDEFTRMSFKNFFNAAADAMVPEPIKVFRADEGAVIPTKAHPDDIGFDLTIIRHEKRISDKIDMYDTGLVVKPPKGYYIEVVPRSSFGKSGFVLANSIGIIDPQYRGTLKVLVVRVDESAPVFQLPYRGFQLVLRRIEKRDVKEVDSIDMDTDRGSGGFGSSG